MMLSRANLNRHLIQSASHRVKLPSFDVLFQVFVPEKSENLMAQLEFAALMANPHDHAKCGNRPLVRDFLRFLHAND